MSLATDVGFCNNITNTEYLDLCYMNVAIRQQNSELCGAITDSEVKQICFQSTPEVAVQ